MRAHSYFKSFAFVGSWRKQGSSRKTSTSASLSMLKPLTVSNTANCGKFLRRWEYQTTLPVSWETCIQVKKQQLELDIEQLTGSEMGKEYIKTVYCLFNLYAEYNVRNAGLDEHKPESGLPGETTSEMQMTPPLWQKAKKN